MSILENLFDGNINPSEKIIKRGSTCHQLNEQLTQYTDELMSLLNKEEKEIFEKIENTIYSINRLYEKEYFIEGFRLGTQMMFESMNSNNPNFLK